MMEAVLQDSAEALNKILEDASPRQIIIEALNSVPTGRLAVVSSFGTESAAVLKLVADVDRSIPVLFLDTGWHFTETLAYRDQLVEVLGLTNVRTCEAPHTAIAKQDPDGDLWFRDPDACCALRKVAPLANALQNLDAWITGRKRFHGAERAALPIVEKDGPRLKFNPLANTSAEELKRMFESFNLPPHPLVAQGFPSVGCMPCTSRATPGEAPRSGRWRGRAKTECGIHRPGFAPEVTVVPNC